MAEPEYPDLSEQALVDQLTSMAPDADPIPTTLRTDKRVLARVTDGIYRQPGSALRELISNAYDADATRVTIRTDRPRFQRIIIEDNGLGMSADALVHLLYHIGGSAKRTDLGAELGVTQSGDSTRSPMGRKLIGKIGIGLFSVAQLTQAFQITTKRRGDDYRTVASVVMRQFAEEAVEEVEDEPGEEQYEAGRVLVWREPATDIDAGGTSIVLTAMRPQTRETLRSYGLWQSIFPRDDSDETSSVRPPRFHIGVVQPSDEGALRAGNASRYFNLPWSPNDDPEEAFRRLVYAIWDAQFSGDPNPRLDRLLDYYLRMVWNLSLQAPLPYLDKHPFDVTGSDSPVVFQLEDEGAVQIELDMDESVRSRFNLADLAPTSVDFSVHIDDLELRRPIDVTDEPGTGGALKKPLLFIGEHHEDFEGVAPQLSGGTLAFQAYLVWAPKIVPTEHAGVLIRVHNASGDVFDETFLRFPVAEQRRLAQISCEVYVTSGFDGALNIDRESVNYAHPHVVALTRWLHRSLRIVIATQKRLGSDARKRRQQGQTDTRLEELSKIVDRVWSERADQDATEPPPVEFVSVLDEESLGTPRTGESSNEAAYLLQRDIVVGQVAPGANQQARQNELEQRIASIAQLLAAYGLLDALSVSERQALLAAIREVIQVADR